MAVSYLVFLILISSLFVSCERKINDDLVMVSFELPKRKLSVTQFNYLGEIVKPFELYQTPIILTDSVELIDSNLNDTKNFFNALQPSLSPSATTQVNCYLLVVSGPSEDPSFSKNYCTKKKDPSVNLIEDQLSEQMYFGSYVGLVDAFNSTGKIRIEVKSGPKRKFTLLGFNSANACSDVFTALRDKSKLSKAYRIASTEPVALTPGRLTEIELQLISEVDPDDYFSDCVIPDPETIYPKYKTAILSKPSFPKDRFRSFSITPTTGFYCEPIDIALRGNDPYTLLAVPATVGEDTYFSLKNSNAIVPTYDTEQNCSADLSVDANQAQQYFKFSKNQIYQKRWFRQTRDGNNNITITISKAAEDLGLSSKSFKQSFSFSDIYLDTVVPKKIEFNVCYESTSFLRDLNGNIITNPTPINITNNIVPTSLVAKLYLTNSDCENGVNDTTTINFASGEKAVSYFVKFSDQGVLSFEFEVGATGVANIFEKTSIQALTSTPVVDLKKVASTRINSRSYFQNNTTLAGGTLDCFPLFVSLVRLDDTEFVVSSTSTISQLPIKVQVSDPTGPETVGYSLYSDNSCSLPIYPIGSVSSTSGTDVVAPPAGSSFYKIYIKPNGTATYGYRKLEFYYNFNIIGSWQFDLTDPTH